MKKIEKYGVQELNSNELSQVNGGLHWIAIVGLSLMIESAIRGAASGISEEAAKG